MEYNQFVCYLAFFVGIIFFAGAIAMVDTMIKYHFDIPGIIVVLILLAFGILTFVEGLYLPYSTEVTYTDAVTVTGGDDLYFVELDGNKINVDNIKKVPKNDSKKYQLRTTKCYSILGKEESAKYALIVPVDVSLLQEGK